MFKLSQRMPFVFLIVSWLAVPAWADAVEPCQQEAPALPADMHDAVAEAESIAESGDYARADNRLSAWLKDYKGEPFAYPYYDLGFFRYRAGMPGKAVDPLETAVRINPCFAEAWQLLATVHYEKGGYKRAAEAMERAADLTASADMLYQSAIFRIKAGQPDKAVEILGPLLRSKNADVDWLIAMASAQIALKKPSRAASAMQSAAGKSGDPDHLYQAALLWLEAEDPKTALPLLQSLAKRPSPQAEWLVALSDTLGKLDKKVETAQAMEEAARTSKRPDLYYQAAWLWLDAGRPKNALPLLETLANGKKPKPDWLRALCSTYMNMERLTDAARTMDRLIDMETVPEPDDLYHGGVLWLQADNPVRALVHIVKLTGLPSPEADWFVVLAHARIKTEEIPEAADAMERAAQISQKPEHAYQAGVLRLQLNQAGKALALLLPLEKLPEPEAQWLAALSNAWAMKAKYAEAAAPMERAAKISRETSYYYRASQLWLQAESPEKALPLLLWLAARPAPEGRWFATLSNAHQMLGDIPSAAAAMERAAGITKEGRHYYRAAMLWRETENMEKTVAMLEASVRQSPVEQRWLIDLAAVYLELERGDDAVRTMSRTNLLDAGLCEGLRYRGAILWLNLMRPEQAMPALEHLCRADRPRYEWMVSSIKTNVELGRTKQSEQVLERFLNLFPECPKAWDLAVWVALQRCDYAAAAAALEVATRFDPSEKDRFSKLCDLYRMAGVPVKAAESLRKTQDSNPTAEDWDRIQKIFLGGNRYDLALAPARKAAEATPAAERWESVGDIAYQLRKYGESLDAYRTAASLSESPGILLKAGYASMKTETPAQAASFFQKAMVRAGDDSGTALQAEKNLEYIRQLEDYRRMAKGISKSSNKKRN